MPRTSDAMAEGVVLRWYKSLGDPVDDGEALAEVETDKVTVVIHAEAAGFLVDMRVGEGGTAPPGAIIASVGPERVSAEAPAPNATAEARVVESPSVPSPHRESDQDRVEERRESASSARLRATPLARRLAQNADLPLREIPGSGPNNRILGSDVRRAVQGQPARPIPNGAGRPPSRVQLITARRMIHSKREIPHYYVDMDVDMTDLIGMREAPEAPEELASASITAFVLRATAMALLEFPTVNASWHESGPVQHGTVNLGVAVALADEWIVVPVIHGADGKSVSEISNAVVSMARKARAGTLTPDEVSGASFTVSNLGMYGVDTFHAIINPPESGILAVGAVVRRPAAVGSEIVLRMIARLSLSADHRVYSGGAAARFLSSIRQALEHPAGALVSTPDASLGEGNDL